MEDARVEGILNNGNKTVPSGQATEDGEVVVDSAPGDARGDDLCMRPALGTCTQSERKISRVLVRVVALNIEVSPLDISGTGGTYRVAITTEEGTRKTGGDQGVETAVDSDNLIAPRGCSPDGLGRRNLR